MWEGRQGGCQWCMSASGARPDPLDPPERGLDRERLTLDLATPALHQHAARAISQHYIGAMACWQTHTASPRSATVHPGWRLGLL